MENNNQEIDELIKQFSKLPGLGPKSAKRIILKLITNKENMIKPLAKSLASVYKNVVRCNECGNLKMKDTQCTCEKNINGYDKICVVENLADMWAIESSNIFKGYFHILGGTLNNNDKEKDIGDLGFNKDVLTSQQEQSLALLKTELEDLKRLIKEQSR